MKRLVFRAVSVLTFSVVVFGFDVTGFVNWYSNQPELEMPENMTFRSNEIYAEFEDEQYTDLKAKVTSEKKYTKVGDSVDVEIITAVTEGEFEDGEGGTGDDEGIEHSLDMDDSPLREDKAEYDFFYEGTQFFHGEQAHIIRFQAKEQDQDHFNGQALFRVSDSLIMQIELQLAKCRTPLKDMIMLMELDYIDGYLVPARFKMNVWAKMFLIFDKKLELDAQYYDFELK